MGLVENNGSNSGLFFLLGILVLAGLFIFFARANNGYDSFELPKFESPIDNNFTDYKISLFDTNSNSLQPQKVDKVGVFFCPEDACAEQLIQKINKADKNIFIAIYSFTQDDIAQSLIEAKKRGVEIEVIFDYDQSANTSSDDEKLIAAGIKVARRNGPGYMHDKYTIIDGNFVATGSFNYSQNADTKNDENLVFIESVDVAAKFKADFDHLWGVSAVAK